MSKNDWPAIFTGVFGMIFIAVAIFAPWLSWPLGIQTLKPHERAQCMILGSVLLGLWAIWRFLV